MNIQIFKVENGYKLVLDDKEYIFKEITEIADFIKDTLKTHDFDKEVFNITPVVDYYKYYYIPPPTWYKFTIMYGI